MNRPASPAHLDAGAPSVRLRNYDVLLMPRESGQPLRFAHGNEVGNRRFRVLLAIFRRRYLAARARGDDGACRSVAREVIATVCDRCVPRGRFFEQDGRSGWRELERDGEATVDVVRRALAVEPIESTPPMERVPAPAVVGRPEDETQDAVRQTSAGFLEMLCDAAEKKSPAPEAELVATPGPFDVVCESSGDKLATDRKCTGNNRLKVLLAIRMRSYKSAPDQTNRRRIAAEVVSSVLEDASGRFLRCHEASGAYETIPRDAALACTERAFDSATRKISRKRRRRTRDLSEAQKLVHQKNRRAILDRAEFNSHKGGGGGLKGLDVFASGWGGAVGLGGPIVPEMAFSSLPEHNQMVPKAA